MKTHALPLLLTAALLAGCAASPPVRLYQLRATPAAARADLPAGLVSLGPVLLPDYLDRSTLVQREGAAGLKALDGHRWAEPLADASARVLRENLAARLGDARVWTPPLPTGLRATRTLRVELLRFEADEGGASLLLAARWTWLDPNGKAAPLVQTRDWRLPIAQSGPDGLAAAHSQALDALAEALATSLPAP
ncbi:hypothetical protein BurJ1DRAFT_3763 [Burkholderiales bacterium JOSHI_001]|nr:hypothetical protein BurJ1DRAFT_3763 [Burkholderiales bacterium JOSHI_001]